MFLCFFVFRYDELVFKWGEYYGVNFFVDLVVCCIVKICVDVGVIGCGDFFDYLDCVGCV